LLFCNGQHGFLRGERGKREGGRENPLTRAPLRAASAHVPRHRAWGGKAHQTPPDWCEQHPLVGTCLARARHFLIYIYITLDPT